MIFYDQLAVGTGGWQKDRWKGRWAESCGVDGWEGQMTGDRYGVDGWMDREMSKDRFGVEGWMGG